MGCRCHCTGSGQRLVGGRCHCAATQRQPTAILVAAALGHAHQRHDYCRGGILVAYGADKLGIGGLVLIALPVMLLFIRFASTSSTKKPNSPRWTKPMKSCAVNVAIERLLAVISHDMRTQIGTIRLYANLLLDSGQNWMKPNKNACYTRL